MLLIGANPKAKIAKLKTVSATSLFMILPSFVQVTTTGQIKGFLTGDRPWSIGVWRPATESLFWVRRTDGLCYAAPPVNAAECPRRTVQACLSHDALVLEG